MKDVPLSGYNKDLQRQVVVLQTILEQSPAIRSALDLIPQLYLPNWYLGAGCITQTVWNYLFGLGLLHGIKDADLIYFDSSDLSEESQKVREQEAKKLLKHNPLEFDVINEARVHLWYEQEFGKKIEPYTSSEDAIRTWPTTVTSIGVRRGIDGNLIIYAPYGLNDLFGLIVRANKALISRSVFDKKVARWTKEWPYLKVIPWED